MENIVENNKLIAEFLEWKNSNWTVPTKGFEIRRKYDLEIPNGLKLYKEEEIQIEGEWGYADVEQERCFYEDLLFHSDWNWLMKVVEKIESLEHWTETSGGLQNICLIGSINSSCESFKAVAETKIEAVYTACLEFIKWYNEQKQLS